jgi:hypothetical protein
MEIMVVIPSQIGRAFLDYARKRQEPVTQTF